MFPARLPRDIPLPIIYFSDEYIELAWNRPGIYLDVDIWPDGSLDWFFRDRNAGISDGNEPRLRRLPLSFFRYLRRFREVR